MSQNTDDVLRIKDLVFWGGEGEVGFFIDPDGFEGWIDAPETRADYTEIPSGHGSYEALEFYESRIITVTGQCLARSDGELGQYRNRLMAALQGRFRIVGKYLGDETYAYGRRFASPRFKTTVPGRRARYQFSLRCADPRRFGSLTPLAVTGPGEAQAIYHRGNFPASPRLIVTGTMPGYRIEGPGSTYVVNRPVSAAEPHRIETDTSLLSVNGAVQLGAITSGTGWTIAPGTSPVTHRLVPLSGAGTLQTHLRDTYI